ncbi:exosortase-associated EpsI family protein [Rhodopirellula sp. JC639]|uniref:exosortase-associated EpsI family protein n=1 Tax=Stieleria mannarensis TaxID=2755585 RepID=UPI0016029FCB|nr:exosortase-associated EpsI family protein [Rhodopirellula sp. JC639]
MPTPPLTSRRPIIVALLMLTLFSGVVHGVLDGRWAMQEDKTATGAALKELPKKIGAWTLVEEGDIDESALQLLRCYGSFMNVYRHDLTKSLVTAAVLYGPRGPIAVHTPEFCYSSEGTDQSRSRLVETITIGDTGHRFWSVEFTRNDDPSDKFEVWYGWSTGGEWMAAEHPRFWLTDDLYKIQLSGPSIESSFNPCESFLTALLPHLEQHIK